MPFLSKSKLLTDNSVLLFTNIYSDRISVFAVSKGKQNDKISILAFASEPQESKVFLDSALDVEKIALNFHKAMLNIPADVMKTAKNIVVGLDAGVSGIEFLQLRLERPDKDKKISQGEIDGLTGKYKNRELFAERSSIDGFAVPNPVGLNGKELVLEAVSVSLADDLAKALKNAAAVGNMSISRFVNMPKAALDILRQARDQRDFLAIFIFENITNVVVARDKSVVNIGNLDIGYGIIAKSVSEKFGVGTQEAKDILKRARNGGIESEIREKTQALIKDVCENFVGKLRDLLSSIDKIRLLPSLVVIGCSGNPPELMAVLSDKQLIKDLPFEQDAEIIAFDSYLVEFESGIRGIEKIDNIFDFIILNSII